MRPGGASVCARTDAAIHPAAPVPGGRKRERIRGIINGREVENMEKNCKRFLSLLLALVMVIGLMPMTAMAAEADGSGEMPQLTVIARYLTNRLTWDADGTTYAVERSEDEQAWEQIGTSDTGAYLDTDAGLGTRYSYRLTAEGRSSAAVRGGMTGMGALKEIAVLFYEGNDSVAFDGSNKVAIAEGEEAAALNAMESGTIVYKAYFNNISGKKAVLGTDSGCYVGTDGSKFRHELGGGFMGNPTAANITAGADNTAGFVYDDRVLNKLVLVAVYTESPNFSIVFWNFNSSSCFWLIRLISQFENKIFYVSIKVAFIYLFRYSIYAYSLTTFHFIMTFS